MKRAKTIITLTAGAILGVSIAGPIANAAESYLQAAPSAQRFFVDGQKVELEAYAIGGYNYVELQDVGEQVDFGVDYDPATNSVQISRKAHYASEAQPKTAGETTAQCFARTAASKGQSTTSR